MTGSLNGTKELASDVRYSLGSVWYDVPTESATYAAKDDLSGKVLTTKVETPPAAPLGFTFFLLGSRMLNTGAHGLKTRPEELKTRFI